jgi:transposase
VGWTAACHDLTARVAAATARIGHLEAVLEEVAAALPAYPLLQTIPGVGPTLAAILVAEIGDIAWDYQTEPAPEAGRPR